MAKVTIFQSGFRVDDALLRPGDIFRKDDATLWEVQPDGSQVQLGAGGGSQPLLIGPFTVTFGDIAAAGSTKHIHTVAADSLVEFLPDLMAPGTLEFNAGSDGMGLGSAADFAASNGGFGTWVDFAEVLSGSLATANFSSVLLSAARFYPAGTDIVAKNTSADVMTSGQLTFYLRLSPVTAP